MDFFLQLGTATKSPLYAHPASVRSFIVSITLATKKAHLDAQEYASVPAPPPIHGRTDVTTAAVFHPKQHGEIFVSYLYGRILYVYVKWCLQSAKMSFHWSMYRYSDQGVGVVRRFEQGGAIIT